MNQKQNSTRKSSVKTKPSHVSRTTIVKMMNETRGRFFTSTHIDSDGKPRTMNCNKKNNSSTELGYITVYVPAVKGYRNINTRTITDFSFGGKHYKARK